MLTTLLAALVLSIPCSAPRDLAANGAALRVEILAKNQPGSATCERGHLCPRA